MLSKTKATPSTQRQRRGYSDHKHVQKQRQNATITPQTKLMKRERTDYLRRLKKMPLIEFAMKAMRRADA